MTNMVSRFYGLALLLVINLVVPNSLAMPMTFSEVTNPATQTQTSSSHCAETTDTKSSQAQQPQHETSSGCCEDCQCSFASCANFVSLIASLSAVANSASSDSLAAPIEGHTNPTHTFFKPPKIS
ncbi:hypothetical protein [Kangiella sp. TOML190]|uniref:hypothetical protein n=1 Tax=Kangiella sp. TOML190 TaxID=2931351 RepID=UPI00203BA25B|nr:hypothetical protein [Kangiella sp. TOML190]